MPTWIRSIFFRWTEIRFMWWRLVIDYPHKNTHCRSQELVFRWAVMDIINKLTMCSPKLYHVKIVLQFSYSWKNFEKNYIYFTICKKNNSPLLLLLNRCKLSYVAGYRCLNLTGPTSVVTFDSHACCAMWAWNADFMSLSIIWWNSLSLHSLERTVKLQFWDTKSSSHLQLGNKTWMGGDACSMYTST